MKTRVDYYQKITHTECHVVITTGPTGAWTDYETLVLPSACTCDPPCPGEITDLEIKCWNDSGHHNVTSQTDAESYHDAKVMQLRASELAARLGGITRVERHARHILRD